MSSIMQILRRIGGAKMPPTSGSAGQIALWKAGTTPTDLRALYAHDGTQWVPLVDYATETLPGLAALASVAEVEALKVADKIVTPKTLSYVIKDRLFANRTYYVRPDGNDANDGLSDTASGAFLTIQKGVNVAKQIDFNGFNLIIKVADGSYASAVISSPFVGGALQIIGNVTTPSSVKIHNSGIAILVNYGAKVNFSGLSLGSSGADGLTVTDPGSFAAFVGPMEFAACANYAINSGNGAQVNATSQTITVTGGGVIFAAAQQLAVVTFTNAKIHFVGSVSYSWGTVTSGNMGSMSAQGLTATGAVTGIRYRSTENSVINTYGGGPNVFPGSIAGITATGGQYV